MIDYQKAGGLSEEVAAERLLSEGDNSLSAKEHKGIFLVIGGVLSEPMFFLLVACSGIYFTLGDLGESIALMVSVLLVVAITVYQENKTEKALGALKDLSSPRALVIRDGVAKRVAGTEVVRGDVIILNEGDRVPADAILFFTNNLLLDESILTGESVSVRKSGVEAQEEIDRPGTDNSASVYASTLVVGGYGMARIVATGNKTEVGKIGASLADVIPEKTRLQSEIDQLIKVFAWYGLALCLAVAIIFGLKNNDWVSGILSGLSLAMSILPEEFPVILTVFMALGAWRLSRKNVLTSRQKVVQALGGITVLCTDKTGTLTMNQMELEAVNDGKKMIATDGSSNEEIENIVELGYLASQPKPFDPLEKALHKTYHDIASNEKPALFKSWRLLEEYPLSHELLVISHVWERPLKDDYLVAAKGAPEAIVEICHLNASQASMWMKQVEEMARKGLRVLAVARAHYKKDKLPE
ncbi:HAD-IC family P-type ATPase, partial [Candidatus Falkowbacteria bacterium]|nr:HAD-IC family P-type ATPase [Candidatus Falkowbacteria bacterium]